MNPADRKYTSEHQWVKLESENEVLIGITDYAQEELGDVVYLTLPSVGGEVEQGKELGEVESVKTVSDIFAPVSGEVTAVNQELDQQPELVNQDPYGKGWIARIRLSDPTELDGLLASEEYEAFLAQEG